MARDADWPAIKAAFEARGARWNQARGVFEFPDTTYCSGLSLPLPESEGGRKVMTAAEIDAAWEYHDRVIAPGLRESREAFRRDPEAEIARAIGEVDAEAR